MDKRIAATTEKIYASFKTLLLKRNYNDIKIQEILDESGIARSTFYAHYKTKEQLLNSICSTIMNHVFSHALEEEKSHDFSKSSIFEYKHFITHILYHIHDEKDLISAIFHSQCQSVFLDYLREALTPFAKVCMQNNFLPRKNVPEEIQTEVIIDTFITIVKYCVNQSFRTAPEVLTEYFMSLNS